jgi:ABC-type uncharacterized transport system substrate-binding protein
MERRRCRLSRRAFAVGISVSSAALLAACGRLPGPGAFQAQPAERMYRLGFLTQAALTEASRARTEDPFRRGLSELGLVEGQNVVIEYRRADGRPERLPELADELASAPLDVIITVGTPAAVAAKNATATVPIVMLGTSDPIRTGLVPSLAGPGGNLTGLSFEAGPGLWGKRLDLLHATVPWVSRVAVLWNPNESGLTDAVERAVDAAGVLGVEAQLVPVPHIDEFDRAFEAVARERAGAICMIGGPFFFVHRMRIADFALRNRLPSMQNGREYAEAGVLMTYGPSFPAIAHRGAAYVDKILKGAKPADLPVEQPMTFEFVVNLKTAQALGITFPNEIMLQVTEVIQ